MNQFATLEFYFYDYLQGGAQLIPDTEFPRRMTEATAEINRRTFGRAGEYLDYGNGDDETTLAIKSCACELAEAYFTNAAAGSLDRVQSQSISGTYSITYADQRKNPADSRAVISGIIHKWLDGHVDDYGEGFLYRG